MKEKENFDISHIFYELLKMVFLVLMVSVCTLAIIKYIWQTIMIEGDSMLPTFADTNEILISKLGDKSAYDRYDIIVFKPYDKDIPETEEDETEILYIKRIVGLPGETIRVTDRGEVMVSKDGSTFSVLEDDPFSGGSFIRGINWNLNDNNYYESVTLGADEYFVLGDNRQISLDSRSEHVRAVNISCIIGKYMFKIHPFGKN